MKKYAIGMIAGLVLTGAVAPAAHADKRMTVQQICATVLPNYKPFAVPGGVRCAANSAQLFWGGSTALEIGSIDVLRPGSRRVDPKNAWSDWIVTNRPAEEKPYQWQSDPGGPFKTCPPQCPTY